MECFEALADFCRTLAGERIWEALLLLSQGEATTTELSRKLGLSGSRTSQLLRQLREAGLVSSRKAGRNRTYYLTRLGEKTVAFGEQVCRRLKTI